jgi:CheY-specific phosphatase CheX
MENKTQQILSTVIEAIMEQVAFVFIDETGATCKPNSPGWDALGASISISGAKNGCIHLWISTSLASCIAANMLAIDNLEDISKAGDAVKELCNIISGNFITSAYQNAEINLGIPEFLSSDSLTIDFDDPEAIWFSAEDEQILVSIKET